MGFWQNLINGNQEKRRSDELVFGRFTDDFSNPSRAEIWDQAILHYEKSDYVLSIVQLLEYLLNSQKTNLSYTQTENEINFSFIQGSKIITGYVKNEFFYAEVKLAHPIEMKIGFLREAIETTYHLQYGRFALSDDQTICLLFDSYLEEASPYKIFYGLKEIAQYADRKDDTITIDFSSLQPVNSADVIPIDNLEKEAKWLLVKNTIKKCLDPNSLGALNPDKFQGALTYILLAGLYKLDFLIKPEAKMMQYLEEAFQDYFRNKSTDLGEKINSLKLKYNQIDQIDKVSFDKELYNVHSTFSWTNQINQAQLKEIIDAEFKSFDWYFENKHFQICEAICTYIIGYLFYNYSFSMPMKQVAILYFELTEPDFFQMINDNKSDSKINLHDLKKKLQQIFNSAKSINPNFNYTYTLSEDSYYLMLKSLVIVLRDANM
ncbi:MAG: hypothetical protein IPH96_14000 [Saprospiraceae bacterium]|nr:hypothetical protein [Saprospiraceae bacterium]